MNSTDLDRPLTRLELETEYVVSRRPYPLSPDALEEWKIEAVQFQEAWAARKPPPPPLSFWKWFLQLFSLK